MGLSIFSYDLMALIKSLENLIPNEPATPTTDLTNSALIKTASGETGERLEQAFDSITQTEKISEHALMSAIASIAATASSAAETKPSAAAAEKPSVVEAPAEFPAEIIIQNPVETTTPPETGATSAITIQTVPLIDLSKNYKLDEETRRAIEEIIRSLQTSVIHAYKSTDIIDETVSLNNLANSAKANETKRADDRDQAIEEDKRRAARRSEELREDLRRAILKNHNKV